jgi:methionyl-tRNA formyltransferase
VHNKIRAFLPWPAVTVDFRGQRCRLIESRVGEPATGPGEPGDIAVTEGGLAVRCGDGRMLDILKLQLENRRVSSGAGFANGFRLKDGDCFTSLAATPG